MDLLKGKVALITGGSRGIGQAIVRKYVAEGASVAFTYHSSEAVANALATELTTPDTPVKGYKSDASSYAAAEELIQQVLQDFGKIDIVINNAGVTRDTLLLRMTEAMWDEVINTNLKSIFNLSKHALKAMLKARSGSIINISSIVGLTGNPGQANYAASKAGIFGSVLEGIDYGFGGFKSNVGSQQSFFKFFEHIGIDLTFPSKDESNFRQQTATRLFQGLTGGGKVVGTCFGFLFKPAKHRI